LRQDQTNKYREYEKKSSDGCYLRPGSAEPHRRERIMFLPYQDIDNDFQNSFFIV